MFFLLPYYLKHVIRKWRCWYSWSSIHGFFYGEITVHGLVHEPCVNSQVLRSELWTEDNANIVCVNLQICIDRNNLVRLVFHICKRSVADFIYNWFVLGIHMVYLLRGVTNIMVCLCSIGVGVDKKKIRVGWCILPVAYTCGPTQCSVSHDEQ